MFSYTTGAWANMKIWSRKRKQHLGYNSKYFKHYPDLFSLPDGATWSGNSIIKLDLKGLKHPNGFSVKKQRLQAAC